MTDCKSINITTLKAGPPTRGHRFTNIYTQCEVHKDLDLSTLTPETNTYDEERLYIQELPLADNFDTLKYPTKGIFVIPYDRPETILISSTMPDTNKKILRCRTQRNGSTLPLADRKFLVSMIYHTYLTDGAPVIAAGEFVYTSGNKSMDITNKSGHYFPPKDTLQYAKCLFEKKGYKVKAQDVPEFALNPFTRNSKLLSEWASKSYKNWYTEMEIARKKELEREKELALKSGLVEGGKRKTRKQKTRKRKTRKSMRGK